MASVLSPRHRRATLYAAVGKRILDVVAALFALILLAPVLIAAALGVALTSPGPMLFVQRRAGRGGRPFAVYKLRTMTHVANRRAHREIRHGDCEVTMVGRLLRRFKIDELPQLLNVLKGDMSIVGPRPGLLEQLPDLDAVGRRRLEARPGLTGLSQISGNIHLSWPERWVFDAAYVERLSLSLDLRIIARTVGVVLFGEERFVSAHPPRREKR